MILGLTLARGGSKGCPHKHTRLLGGKPLIAWTIEAAKSARLDAYYVSSDDPDILRVAKEYGVPVVVRPPELCADNTPTMPALQWSVIKIEEVEDRRFDFIVEIRATSPFKTTEDINNIIDFVTTREYDSVIGVTPIPEDRHPARLKWLEDGLIRDFIPEPSSGRRQDLKPKAYVRNGTVYAFPRTTLFSPQAKLFGHARSFGYVMPNEMSVNIDDEADFSLAERMLNEYPLG